MPLLVRDIRTEDLASHNDIIQASRAADADRRRVLAHACCLVDDVHSPSCIATEQQLHCQRERYCPRLYVCRRSTALATCMCRAGAANPFMIQVIETLRCDKRQSIGAVTHIMMCYCVKTKIAMKFWQPLTEEQQRATQHCNDHASRALVRRGGENRQITRE